MKRIRLVLIALMSLLLVKSIDAQSIRVMTVQSSNISEIAAEMLYNRLNQAVSLNGFASMDNTNKFLLVPTVTVVSIEPATTAPVQYLAEVEVSLLLVDNVRKMLISQEMLTKKGVAKNGTKAVEEAIKSIKARDARLKRFIINGKKKIVEYYNVECENLVETINAYVEMGMYDEALDELNAMSRIDEVSDCYKDSMDVLSRISAEQQAKSNGNIKNVVPDVSWINK